MSEFERFEGPWDINDVHYRQVNDAWADDFSAEINAGQGNLTDAWFGGGLPGPTTHVDRIIFSNDTSTAIQKGPL